MNVSQVSSVPDRLSQAIEAASTATGAPFSYLLETARRESAFNPEARAPNTSATGMFQFIDGTWLELVHDAGPKYGLNDEAAAIARRQDGRYVVADPQERQQILALRNDPELSSLMAGEFAGRNARQLTQTLGRAPTSGELYIAHFLGAGGAGRFIAAAEATPDASAARLFPAQAAANRPVFYDHGRARSLGEVYAVLTRNYSAEPATATEAPTALAYGEEVPTGGEDPFALFAAMSQSAAPVNAVPAPAAPAAEPEAEPEAPAIPGRFAPIAVASGPAASRFAPVSQATEAPPSRFAVLALQTTTGTGTEVRS